MNRLTLQRSCKRTALRASVLLATLGCAASAQAIDVYFTGTLVAPPPCVINSNTAITVDFGTDMLAGRVNGINYEKSINFPLDCSAAIAANRYSLRVIMQADIGTNALSMATSNPNLEIQIRKNGSVLPIGAWSNFTYPDVPTFSAVPVKKPGSTLSGGAFTASATLLVDYQ